MDKTSRNVFIFLITMFFVSFISQPFSHMHPWNDLFVACNTLSSRKSIYHLFLGHHAPLRKEAYHMISLKYNQLRYFIRSHRALFGDETRSYNSAKHPVSEMVAEETQQLMNWSHGRTGCRLLRRRILVVDARASQYCDRSLNLTPLRCIMPWKVLLPSPLYTFSSSRDMSLFLQTFFLLFLSSLNNWTTEYSHLLAWLLFIFHRSGARC